MDNKLGIRSGHFIDPSQNIDQIMDILIVNGKVRQITPSIEMPESSDEFDASGLVVTPGFIDLHCHLREPGQEHKETIKTATRAAASGGFTTICAMPNTDPVMDNQSVVDFVINKSNEVGHIRVLPIGSVTRGSKGKHLTDMNELAEAGVIGFSDDGNPVWDPNIMRQAVSYSMALGLPVINHCETLELSAGGTMNEGWISNRLGLKGVPNAAEDSMVARDIAISKLTGGNIHIAHISTKGSIDLVREAKTQGVNITCEVTPHHLTLTDSYVMGVDNDQNSFGPLNNNAYDTYAKVNPPLRSRNDVGALREGLIDGTIDFVATDHAPHSVVDKECTFDEAAFGISVLETALASLLSLFHKNLITMPFLVDKLTTSPAKFLQKDIGTLKVGSMADIAIFDPNIEWTVDSTSLESKGKNTPLSGKTLKGKVIATFFAGQRVY